MFRGAFGHALRAAVCSMGPEQACESCSLRGPCVYTRVFETFVEGEPPPLLRGVRTAPRPLVFEPVSEGKDFSPGDRLVMDLVLVGQAAELQAHAVRALGKMAVAGLGEARAPFRLVAVDRPDGNGWTSCLERPAEGGRAVFRSAPAGLPRVIPEPGSGVTVRFSTPTRVLKDGQPLADLSFRELVFAMLRRVLEVAHFHVPGAEVSWEFREYLDRASEVEVVRGDLRWYESERFSSRQGRRHTTSGFVGEMELAGPVGEFLPLLAAAEVLHVGKGATFGLGRVEVLA